MPDTAEVVVYTRDTTMTAEEKDPRMLEGTSPEHAAIIQRLAQQAKDSSPKHSAAIEAATVMLLQDAVIPPPADGEQIYTVLDGQAYDIDLLALGSPGSCACPSEESVCAHRIAVRLYLQSQAELQAAMEEEPAPETPQEQRPYPEMPFSINTFIYMQGRRCQVTVRSMNDAAGLERFEAILARYPEPPLPDLGKPAPVPAMPSEQPETPRDSTPAPPRPVVPAGLDASPREDWCYVHQAPMNHNERGWAHKIEEGIWCAGRWCREHNLRYWENKSKRGTGTYFSHRVEDGPICYEKKKPWQA